ncbi:hypothetical protein CQ017_15485 [Arthrobacter sp. MYb224]|nr:hypothetical protein CQ017_15485 [Arthrobacter sp. MYb224]
MVRTMLFESWRGRYADSPRAISEGVSKLHPEIRLDWVATDEARLPENCTPVKRHSPDYFRKLLTTDFLVANDIVSKHLLKGPRVTYIQCWHGTPLKKVGFDESHPSSKRFSAHMRRVVRDVRKWDYLVSPSPACTELLRSAFRYDGHVLETGYPRNDILNSPQAPRIRQRVRARLGVSPDQLVVLYAPTWRDDSKDEHGRFRDPSAMDYKLMSRLLPAGTVVLNRLHTVVQSKASTWQDERLSVVDVSRYSEVADLYLAADVLVSDYSSAIYDFAVTGKPIILYPYDLVKYSEQTRGLYFDYHQWAPGPITQTLEELIAELLRLDDYANRFAPGYEMFRQRFCPLEDGQATSRLLAAVLQ